MSTGRRPGRPTIYEEAMTPSERQRRWRAKAKEAGWAESSVAPGPRRYRRDDLVKRLGIERRAYITLLAPMDELRVIAEVEGKVTELLERMSPGSGGARPGCTPGDGGCGDPGSNSGRRPGIACPSPA